MSDVVLTANRLTDGIAVWYSTSGTWAESIQQAEVTSSKERTAELEAIGKQAFVDNLVVDVAIVDVKVAAGSIQPLRMREQIRANGPSIAYAPGYGLAAQTQTV